MVDHGSNGAFKISSNKESYEIVYALTLKKSIDKFVEATGREVIVILEACNSGSFISTLTDNTHGKTSVIASSEANQNSFIDMFGAVSFTKLLFKELLAGDSLNSAVTQATEKLPSMGDIYRMQNPQWSLTKAVEQECLNSCFASASVNLSSISELKIDGSNVESDIIDLTNKSKIDIEVKLNAGDVIKKVWVVVLTPDYIPPKIGNFESPDLNAYTQELKYDDESDTYKVVYDINSVKTYDGNYSISVYAEDKNGYIAALNHIYQGDGEIEVSEKVVTNTEKLTIDLIKGWNLVSLNSNLVNMNKNINILWQYQNKKWSAYSPIEATQKVINETKSIDSIVSLNIKQGTWILVSEKLEIKSEKIEEQNEKLLLNETWNLVGTNKDLKVNNLSCHNGDIKTIWKYKNEKWLLNTKVKNDLNLESFETINANEGFCVNCE
jgi:hypothetical protein